MKYNLEIHHRRSIRLKEYNYAQAGAYYVTICVKNKECLFGDIKNGESLLNEYGKIVETEWLQTGNVRTNVELDEFIVMPNHFHGIIIINAGNNCSRGMARHAPTERQFAKPIANSLPTIIGSFKSAVSKSINRIRNTPGAPVWHRNYYEHIIRDEYELHRIREYIICNPMKWDEDEYNPNLL
jgi:REP element-mobilizing transposase RayT